MKGYARRYTMTERQTMIELYRNGWTTRRIADQFGCRRENVYAMLRRRGVPIRSRYWKRNENFRGSGEVRGDEADGVIVTLRAQDDGELRSRYENGPRREAMRKVAAWCDAQERDWRVLSYSTPLTILSDMNGTRADVSEAADSNTLSISTGSARRPKHIIFGPEMVALGHIGRRDLLDPELEP